MGIKDKEAKTPNTLATTTTSGKTQRMAWNLHLPCPIDHTGDPPLVESFYKLVKRYSLPFPGDVVVNTVHRCFLSQLGPGLSEDNGVGDGATAAVVSWPGRGELGPIYINTDKQAACICDVVTCM